MYIKFQKYHENDFTLDFAKKIHEMFEKFIGKN